MPSKRTHANADEAALACNETQIGRFWLQVIKTKSCWFFDAKTSHGYGRFHASGYDMHAHRAAKIWADNCLPLSNFLARHKCRNKDCVRPSHIEWGTARQNIADKRRDGTIKPWTHCGERHPNAKISDLTASKIFDAYASGGVTMQLVAAKFGVKRETVSNIVHGRSWRDVVQKTIAATRRASEKGYMRGEQHARAKLTLKKIADARVRIKNGETMTAVARHLQVARSSLSAALLGKTWKSL